MIFFKELVVKELDKKDWDIYWNSIKFSNLLQSWEYGNAKKSFFCKPSRLIIKSWDNKPLAIVQILIYKVFFFPSLARINRGPLILNQDYFDYSNNEFYFEIIKALELRLKSNNSFFLSISPELESNDYSLNEFIKNGYKKRKKISWASSRISLDKEESKIYMSFKSKWRNMLRKSERSELYVKVEENSQIEIKDLFNIYEKLQIKKGFKGIKNRLIANLALQESSDWKFVSHKCFKKFEKDEILVGNVVSINHGNTATYLIGYTNQLGRKYNANYLLIWESIIYAKKFGCNWYDMGGFNKNTPAGISHFKKGLNGIFYNNIEEFFKFLNFLIK